MKLSSPQAPQAISAVLILTPRGTTNLSSIGTQLWHLVSGEPTYAPSIKLMREGCPRDGVPDMATQSAQFETRAWWWTRNQIGRDLRERYEVPKDLPPELLTLVGKLDEDDWLFPNVSWQDDVDLVGGRVRR